MRKAIIAYAIIAIMLAYGTALGIGAKAAALSENSDSFMHTLVVTANDDMRAGRSVCHGAETTADGGTCFKAGGLNRAEITRHHGRYVITLRSPGGVTVYDSAVGYSITTGTRPTTI